MRSIYFQTPARHRRRRSLDQLIEETLAAIGPLGEPLKQPAVSTLQPRTRLRRADDAYRLEVELPGIGREALQLEIRDGELRLEAGSIESGKTTGAAAETPPRYRRSIPLPEEIHLEGITAKLAHGLLTVHLPKTPKAVGRTIEIA